MSRQDTPTIIEAKLVPPYDPSTDLQLDLTHDEKLRVTALMLAIQYYERTIVTDGALYSAMKAHGVEFRAAHPDHVVEIGAQFLCFLAGDPLTQAEMNAIEPELQTGPTEEPPEKETPDYLKNFNPSKSE
jgi:hypothetical protein